ncbi:MAG TPA: sulfur oxidation c-type cytochrome SoxA [Burkholderiales bacterium]|jgi:sulfur-oxidizing protein SoxA|nr:sulfur oxidation c-type cytochrome SoxA [Burkholderiales bacterium]
MGRETRAMQDDEQTGPAVLWLLEGEELWGKNCAGCHRIEKMKGVAARFPAFDSRLRKLVNLDDRINLCRTEHQKAPAWTHESRELLSLNAFISRQSRGMPIAVELDEKTKPFIEAGRAQFEQRRGQLNLSCAQCHDDNWGKSLAGTPIPQAHPTGYPIYRLEWQGVGSLERRLRNCMIGVRAEPYAYGAEEYRVLELFLMWRARGMKLESPGVRP